MEVRVLGPLEVTVAGTAVRVPPGRQRGLLIALLLKPGALVPAERLIGLLWPDGGVPANARNALQTLVARLRSALGPAAGALRTRDPGYLFDPSGLDLDVTRFLEGLAEAGAAGPAARRVACLDAALGLWRGPAYAEFADGFARGEAMRLEQLRTQAEESRIELLPSLGRTGEAVAAAEALVAAHPHRDGAVAVLMRSLHAAGRTVEALDAFIRHRAALNEEYGVDPAPALADLYARLLRHERPDAGPVPPPDPPRPSVPVRRDSFVGRDGDLRAVRELLEAHRIVTLAGTGGVGKTRLAAQVAAGLPEVRWIELGGLSDDGATVDVVAAALGATGMPGASTAEAIHAWARTAGGCVVVLDNCEHLIDAAAGIAEALTGPGTRLRVLATSREALGVGGEAVWRVEPLPAAREGRPGDAALRLFFDRARLRAPALQETPQSRATAAALCRALDGLPLAIELAAAGSAALSPGDLLERLPASLDALRGPRGGDGRHRTLRATIGWSYRLLEPVHRELFARLAVFNAPFTLADAEAVAAGGPIAPGSVAGGVARLVEQHMLVRTDGPGPGRYRMLRVVRAFALGLPSDAERAATALRHAEHLAWFARDALVGLSGADEPAWNRRLEAALPDLHAAFAFAAGEGRWDLCRVIVSGTARWAYQGRRHDLLELGGVLLDRDPGKDLDGSARTAVAASAWLDGRLEEADRIAGSPDEPPATLADVTRGDVNLLLGRLDVSDACYLAALESCPPDDLWLLSRIQASRAMAQGYAGRSGEAAPLARAAARTAHASGSPSALSFAAFVEAEVIGDADPDRALRRTRFAREKAAEAGSMVGGRLALIAEVTLRGRHGDPATAFALYAEVLAAASEERGGDPLTDTALRNLVPLLTRTGGDRDAAVLAGFLSGPATDKPSYGQEADRMEAALRSAASRLGGDVVAALVDEGRTLTRRQALDLARGAVAITGGPR